MTPEQIEEYRLGPSGIGPHADTWTDKPHRLVYDLCQALARAEQRRQDAEEARISAIQRAEGERLRLKEAAERVQQAEATTRRLRCDIDGLDCSRREGNGTYHCRHDTPCLACRERRLRAALEAVRGAVGSYACPY